MLETTKYNHNIASYPKEWKGYVVSPQKICIQFNNVQCKTRVTREFKKELDTYKAGYVMPVYSHGTDIPTLAVGIPITLYPEVFNNLLEAIKEHDSKYPEHSLKEFMLDYAFEILKEFNYGK